MAAVGLLESQQVIVHLSSANASNVSRPVRPTFVRPTKIHFESVLATYCRWPPHSSNYLAR